jgi:alkanesulfonate monooxygenase SsuD/methylene tetrahydromethanopterin reductase-like flavin-dependent oxidoreductase (luciferase family)
MLARMMVGSVDRVAEQMAGMTGDDGLDGFVVMLPADAADPDGPRVAARALRAAGLLD